MVEEKVVSSESSVASGEELSSPTEKHQLEYKWVLWYDGQSFRGKNPTKHTKDQKDRAKDWIDGLERTSPICTVEDFWSFYNQYTQVITSTGKQIWQCVGLGYYFFREGIPPLWEDTLNSSGGKWTIMLNPDKDAERLEQVWIYTLLACIGSECSRSDDICGATLAIKRRQLRVAVWVRDAESEGKHTAVGTFLKEYLKNSGMDVSLTFTRHSDSIETGVSYGSKEICVL